jgi:signal transduction histidine kinase/purine-cytosine permease-like protein/DNA-binding LytR/AlgR family response regulator
MMEDFALRYTSKRARKWSYSRISITALGIVSFMVLEAIGGAITLNYGFTNAAWAILALVMVVFISGLPISYYAARYGVDADLLSRGAGFGYMGSTITSLIYASFTFIFFALEAAIMAMALLLWLDIPLSAGYAISALVVIPLASHGITNISRFQIWTQPIWIVLQLIPLLYIIYHPDTDFIEWINFSGDAQIKGGEFDILLFGAASAVLLSLVAQIGEQVDFLRFLPATSGASKPIRWWFTVIMAGPGWVIFGAAKLFLGSYLAYFALQQGIDRNLATNPAHMYQTAFSYIMNEHTFGIALAAIFVILSQLKINVANAYAGSLAWSNFFSRLTHHHPGRVVWMVFNILIALLLMELGVYQTIENMLQVYSVLVLAWLSSVVADLIINKPLGISPAHIEFRRSKLYDINPVGTFSMIIASAAGFYAHSGLLGELAQAMGSFIAFFIPFVTVPVIGVITKGKFYLVTYDKINSKQTVKKQNNQKEFGTGVHNESEPPEQTCCMCENEFDREDMAFCPAYSDTICSLCCSLDVRCGDKCREHATFAAQIRTVCRRYLSEKATFIFSNSIAQWAVLTTVLTSVIAIILFLIYKQMPPNGKALDAIFVSLLMKIFFFILIIIGIVSWLFTLARTSNRSALKELREQSSILAKEVQAHEKTSQAHQLAIQTAESANQAKSRYLAGLSHELRTPLNVLLGYAQLLSKDTKLSQETRLSINTMKRNGEHLADLIEGILEVSKIEAGRMFVHRDEVQLRPLLEQLVNMFKLQAVTKGLAFKYDFPGYLPEYVITDKQRFRQVLINLISNAIKFTQQGSVNFRMTYRYEVAHFYVEDTGPGIKLSDQELIFRPFERVLDGNNTASGTGLGLTISRALTELMGGDIILSSELGKGSCFKLSLMMPKVAYIQNEGIAQSTIMGYEESLKTILVVDDEVAQRDLVKDILTPIGFTVICVESAFTAMDALNRQPIDLILLDLKMPDVNGWKAAKQMRESGFIQPIVIVSANVRDLEVSNTAVGQHSDYLVKPFAINALLEKVGHWLGLTWVHEATEGLKSVETNIVDERALAGKNQFTALKVLAEIGYLSGFTSKLHKINHEYAIPCSTYQELKDFAQQCQFQQIIQKLDELIEASATKPE